MKFYNSGVNGQWSEFKFHFYNGTQDETTKYMEPFNTIEEFRKWSQFSDERPIVPEYVTLYKQLFNAREEKLGKPMKEVIDMSANENQDIKKAVEKLEYVNSNRDERFRIDQIDKARIDHLAEMAANREEGFNDGIE